MEESKSKYYIRGLSENNSLIIREIIKEFGPRVKQFLSNKSFQCGQDAKDIFQIALTVIFRKTQESNFQLTSSFSTYLLGISNNQCLKRIRDVYKKQSGVTIDDVKELRTIDPEFEEESRDMLRMKLYKEKFNLIPQDCQKLLTLSLKDEMDMQTVAEQMNITYKYARKRKSVCKKKLTDLIKEDSRFDDLKN